MTRPPYTSGQACQPSPFIATVGVPSQQLGAAQIPTYDSCVPAFTIAALLSLVTDRSAGVLAARRCQVTLNMYLTFDLSLPLFDLPPTNSLQDGQPQNTEAPRGLGPRMR